MTANEATDEIYSCGYTSAKGYWFYNWTYPVPTLPVIVRYDFSLNLQWAKAYDTSAFPTTS